jgi:uncharacterized repeat protein (TIGR01451 family)
MMRHDNRNTRIRRPGFLLWALAAVAAGVVSLHAEGTTPGTVIRARSLGTYTSQGQLIVDSVYSNFTATVVEQKAAVNLIPPAAARNSQSDSTIVDFPIRVVNAGNGRDVFDLSTVSSRGWLEGLYSDLNGDGVLQSSEILAGRITSTAAVGPDSSFALVARVFIPRDPTLSGHQDTLYLTARSRFDNQKSATGRYITGVQTVYLAPLNLAVDIPTPYRGQDVTFTLTFTNVGSATASNIVVTDQLPTEFSFQRATPTGGSYNDLTRTVTWPVGSVGQGGSVSLTVVIHVSATVPIGTIIPNALTVRYSVGTNTFMVNSNVQQLTVAQNPGPDYDIALSPTQFSTQKEPLDTVIYKMTAKNLGVKNDVFEFAAASTDTLIRWEFYLDKNRNGRFDAGDQKLTNTNAFAGVDADTVASGDSINVFAVSASPLPRVQFDQTEQTTLFSVSSAGKPTVKKDANAITVINIPIVSVAVAVNPSPLYLPGDSVTYTISYQNIGHAAVDSFLVINSLPAETQYISSSVRLNGVAQEDRDVIVAETPDRITVRARVGMLAPNAHGTVTLRAKIK